jgi:orotate phosphoribosyltransferase
MDPYKREFIDLMLGSEVLRFGDFVGKSGRRMPYFIDAGRYRTGAHAAHLGRCYARAIEAHFGSGFDVLFGPAYKGIPLCVATSIALHDSLGRDVSFCFNRKEAKDHGEGGMLVGHPLRDGDRVLIIEDVITAGTAVRQSIDLLRGSAAIELVGLIVGVDRMERGTGELSALAELEQRFSMKARAIVTIDDVVADLRRREADGERLLTDADYTRISDYRAQWGV